MGNPEHVEAVKEASAEYVKGNLEPLFALMAQGVEWIVPGSSKFEWPGTYKGVDEVRSYLAALRGQFEITGYETHDLIHQGDFVILHSTVSVVHTGGDTANYSKIDFMRFEGGKIKRFEEFLDTAKFAEADEATAQATA